MKKFLSIALALTMCLSLSIPAFAADSKWKMEVLGKSDAETFVGERTFTVRDWNKGSYDAEDKWNATLKTDTREWKVDNLCVMAKDDIAVFTKGGESFYGFYLMAWSDSDGDGVYDNQMFGIENTSTDFADTPRSSAAFYDYAIAYYMPNSTSFLKWDSEYGDFGAIIGEVTGATEMTELKLPANYLLERYGANTLIWFFEYNDDEKLKSIGTVLVEGDTAQPASPSFSDVKASDYFAEPVAWAVERGITVGTSASTFSPNVTCTQGQILTFLWRAKGEPAPAVSVNDTAYYAKAAQWAKEQGLTDNFSADADCTRAMVVTYLWKLAGSPQTGASAFTDVPADAPYAQAVAWAVAQGITNGTGNGSFSPNATCTRGQIVTFLFRALAK